MPLRDLNLLDHYQPLQAQACQQPSNRARTEGGQGPGPHKTHHCSSSRSCWWCRAVSSAAAPSWVLQLQHVQQSNHPLLNCMPLFLASAAAAPRPPAAAASAVAAAVAAQAPSAPPTGPQLRSSELRCCRGCQVLLGIGQASKARSDGLQIALCCIRHSRV